MPPSNKLTLVLVAKEFTDNGCELLELEHRDNKSLMRFICFCRGLGVKSLVHYLDNYTVYGLRNKTTLTNFKEFIGAKLWQQN